MTVAMTSFEPLLQQLRHRAWMQAALYALAGALLVAALARLLSLSPTLPALAVGLGLLAWRRVTDPVFNGDVAAFTAHLDRSLPELEESAGLWLRDPAQLGVLQRMQRERIDAHWPTITGSPERWLPALRTEVPALVIAMALLLFLFPGREIAPVDIPAGEQQPPAMSAQAPVLHRLLVEPPAYTGLDAFGSEEYDVAIPEGSTLSWEFRGDPGESLRLAISDGSGEEQYVPLTPRDDGALEASTVLERTSLYRLERREAAGYTALPGVHTLSVTLDRPPRLRMLEPQQTRIEIPRDAPAQLDYRVAISDDYGVAEVAILASVAKGSGEGVKFRDERFTFDRQVIEDGVAVYTRLLRLSDLGMEPGDEVYLFATALDNHPGEAQQGRSDTLVVRWLDEVEELEAGDGLAISVLPEYFKSQRQIIIETEQLIADHERLSTEEFEDTAYALGQAQSELKERYGQYLGDEFDEGDAPEGTGVPAFEADKGDDQEAHGHAEAGHVHEEAAGPSTGGSAAELIQRFAHDHGAAEIGPITSRSPVGLMKRSVANMWEAELQLRLADPEAALPFEYEALRYFDLARQAERIYTRRLGFEPPPVSEERRLSGELDDVSSRERVVVPQPDPSFAALMRELFQFLGTTATDAALNDAQRDLVQRAAREFTQRAEQRPALIESAAQLERLRVSGRFGFDDCVECLSSLRAATWSLLPAADPGPGVAERLPVAELSGRFLQRLDLLRPANGAANGDKP